MAYQSQLLRLPLLVFTAVRQTIEWPAKPLIARKAPLETSLLIATAVYEQGLQSMHNAAINGRSNPYGHTVRSSSDPYSNGYTHITTPQGMPTPEATEPWSAPMSVTMPSTVSSPASCGPAEDYRYMPTPVSGPLIDPASLPPTSVPFQNHDVDQYDSGVDSGKNRPHHGNRYDKSTFSGKFAGPRLIQVT